MQSSEYSIVIIDSDADSARRIEKYIKDLGDHATVEGVALSFETGYEIIHKKRPKVVIMEIGPDRESSLTQIRTVIERFPQVSVFATSSDKSSDTILSVMKAGAAEFILRPVDENDLASALQKHGRLWISQTGAQNVKQGRIVTIYSPKGGVGATTMAINIASDLYSETQKPTILVDLDLEAGDVSTFLNLKPAYTISDVTLNMSRLDRNFLMSAITKHDSGVHILAEPQRVEDGISIPDTDVRKVLNLLKPMFSWIVLDTKSGVDTRTMVALEMSDIILLPFVLSLPGIRNMQRYLRYFEEAGFHKDRVRIVANRYVKSSDIQPEDAARVLGYPIFWALPNDYEASMECLNKGITFNTCSPRSKLNESVRDLTRAIIKIPNRGE